MADYKLGYSDPRIQTDVGAGPWSSRPKTLKMRALRARLRISISLNIAAIGGNDAVIHLHHYLDNTGNDLTIDLASMVQDVPSAKRVYEKEQASAKKFVETLPEGIHLITSSRASGGYNHRSESTNWYFAIGGYSAWGKGRAVVSKNRLGIRGYKLKFEYKFYDRYNWDTGKSVKLGPIEIKDEFMGDFHRQGLGKEYDVRGSLTEDIQWGAFTSTHESPHAFSPAIFR